VCAARPEQKTGARGGTLATAIPGSPAAGCRRTSGGNTVSMHAATVAYDARPRLCKRRPAYPAGPGVEYFVSLLTEACPADNPALDSALPPMLHPPVCKASSPPVPSRSMCCICRRSAAHRRSPCPDDRCIMPDSERLWRRAAAGAAGCCGGSAKQLRGRYSMPVARGCSQLADVSSGRGATTVGRRAGGGGVSRRW